MKDRDVRALAMKTMLKEYSDVLGNAGCNDSYPTRFGMMEKEYEQLGTLVNKWLGETGGEPFSDHLCIPDWIIVDYLAATVEADG